jgi:hypothetical protein
MDSYKEIREELKPFYNVFSTWSDFVFAARTCLTGCARLSPLTVQHSFKLACTLNSLFATYGGFFFLYTDVFLSICHCFIREFSWVLYMLDGNHSRFGLLLFVSCSLLNILLVPGGKYGQRKKSDCICCKRIRCEIWSDLGPIVSSVLYLLHIT